MGEVVLPRPVRHAVRAQGLHVHAWTRVHVAVTKDVLILLLARSINEITNVWAAKSPKFRWTRLLSVKAPVEYCEYLLKPLVDGATHLGSSP